MPSCICPVSVQNALNAKRGCEGAKQVPRSSSMPVFKPVLNVVAQIELHLLDPRSARYDER